MMATELKTALIRLIFFATLCACVGVASYFFSKGNFGSPVLGVIISAAIFMNTIAASLIHGLEHQAFVGQHNRFRDHVMLIRFIELGTDYQGNRFDSAYQYADEFMLANGSMSDRPSIGNSVITILGSSALFMLSASYGVATAQKVSILSVWG